MYVEVKGITFAQVLTILFVGLKLTGFIDWSWWWVVSPVIIEFVVINVLNFFLGD